MQEALEDLLAALMEFPAQTVLVGAAVIATLLLFWGRRVAEVLMLFGQILLVQLTA
jgi:hypothetical protein